MVLEEMIWFLIPALQARLTAEREAMLRDRGVEANMAQIQLNLERRDEEGKLRLEDQCDQLKKELDLMRKRVDQEQEQYRTSVRAWEQTNMELREKTEGAEGRERAAMEQMTGQAETINTMKYELRDAQEQLQLAECRLAGRGMGKQQSMVEAGGEGGQKSRLRDVELLMAQTKQELKSVNNQLNKTRKRAEEFKGMSEAAEKRMVESSAALMEFKDHLEAKLKKAEEEKEVAEKKAGECLTQATELAEKVAVLESEAGASGGEPGERLRTSLAELEEARGSLASTETVAREAREQAERMEGEAREAQEKYEREMVLHAKDIEALNKIKSEVRSNKVDLDEVEREKFRVVEVEVEKLAASLSSLSAQVEAMAAENSALHKQMETASQQMADLSSTGPNTSGLDTSGLNTSLGEEDVARSGQLVAIIKYLRQEKEILASRVEVLGAEAARTASQLAHQQSLKEDAEAALALHREKESGAVMSATKHGELIRKVETMSAMTDNSGMLLETKDRLEKQVEQARLAAATFESRIGLLEERLKDSEKRVANLVVEKSVLQKDADKWKKRSDQLVDKSVKINPEELKELKELQEDKIKLTKMVQNLTAAKKQLDTKAVSQSQELGTAKQPSSQALEEARKQQAGGEGDQKSMLRDVKLLMAQTKQELTSVNSQLNRERKRSEEFKSMSEAVEKRMVESSVVLKVEVLAFQKRLEDKEQELAKLKQESQGVSEESEALLKETRQDRNQWCSQLTSVSLARDALEVEARHLRREVAKLKGQHEVAQVHVANITRGIEELVSRLATREQEVTDLRLWAESLEDEVKRLEGVAEDWRLKAKGKDGLTDQSQVSYSTTRAIQGRAATPPLASSTDSLQPSLKRSVDLEADFDQQKKARRNIPTKVSCSVTGQSGGITEPETDLSMLVEGWEERGLVDSSEQYSGHLEVEEEVLSGEQEENNSDAFASRAEEGAEAGSSPLQTLCALQTHVCHGCQSVFTQPASLRHHQAVVERCKRRKELEPQEFACHRCYRQFNSKSNYSRHVTFVLDCLDKKKRRDDMMSEEVCLLEVQGAVEELRLEANAELESSLEVLPAGSPQPLPEQEVEDAQVRVGGSEEDHCYAASSSQPPEHRSFSHNPAQPSQVAVAYTRPMYLWLSGH